MQATGPQRTPSMISQENLISIVQSRIEQSSRSAGRNGFPYVTLSYAQSVDGSIAYRQGRPLALSGRESIRMTHRIRSLHDGILVGIGTILADNPRLTVRYAEGNNPRPIIVDSRLRLPVDADAIRFHSHPPWVVTSEESSRERESVLKETGVTVLRVRSHTDGFIDLAGLLELLRKRGISSLMVEGGASIITSFLRCRLIDQMVLTLAPVVIGGMQAVWPLQLDFTDPPRLRNVDLALFGPDLVMRSDLAWKAP